MKVKIYEMYLRENRLPYLKATKTTSVTDEECYNRPDRIARLLKEAFHADRLSEERVWAIVGDNHYHITAVFEISKGTFNSSAVSPASVLTRALLCGASVVAVGHNHPSGDCEPSEEDIIFTQNLKSAVETCGMAFADHVIVGSNCRNAENYYSFRDGGLI